MSASVPPSVRLALPHEAADVAKVQRELWAEVGGAPASVLLATDLAELTEAWTMAIRFPRDARCRVLVAVEDARVLGFATTHPSDDPDAEPTTGSIGEFALAAVGRGRGHGSRLLNACVDTLRADKFTTATHWVITANDGLRAFFIMTGWSADGAHREIGTNDGSARLKQVRMHTRIV